MSEAVVAWQWARKLLLLKFQMATRGSTAPYILCQVMGDVL